MSLYYEGYQEARWEVLSMTSQELLEHIDGLYGRENLPKDYTIEELRAEALRQTKQDFTDVSSKEYEQVEFYSKLFIAMQR